MHEIHKGCAEELKSGKDVVLFAIGAMVSPCLEASKILETNGIKAGVVNARFVKPLDEQMIRKMARDVGVIVTVEDNIIAGGFGSAVLEHVNAQKYNWAKILRLGLPDEFIEHGTRNELLDKYGLTPEKIATSVSLFVKQTGVK
jgi:1-deoxy-D-xylulose-5-phosphate synthase